MAHAILSRSLHAAELGRGLEALVPKATLVWGSKAALSIAVVVVAIATTGVTTVSYVVATILSLTATEGGFGPTTKPSISVPVTTPTKVTPATSIPIPTVILVATSSPPSTACIKERGQKKVRRELVITVMMQKRFFLVVLLVHWFSYRLVSQVVHQGLLPQIVFLIC